MARWERDLTPQILFLRDVIARLKSTDPNHSVFTKGPWYGFGLIRLRWATRKTGGRPRGVAVKDENMFILIHPTIYEGVLLDEDVISQQQIRDLEDEFKQTGALMLHQFWKLAGDTWHEAWEATEAAWRARGREVPDFEEFLQEE